MKGCMMELESGVCTPYTTPVVHDPTNLIEELAMEEGMLTRHKTREVSIFDLQLNFQTGF
jgi:hypothetical protein